MIDLLHRFDMSGSKPVGTPMSPSSSLSVSGSVDPSEYRSAIGAYVNTLDHLADLLTKPLHRTQFQLLRSKISVADGTSILRGRIME
ncbi:hypothetical protein ACS0TY_034415 [Phlomoides rotata]